MSKRFCHDYKIESTDINQLHSKTSYVSKIAREVILEVIELFWKSWSH